MQARSRHLAQRLSAAGSAARRRSAPSCRLGQRRAVHVSAVLRDDGSAASAAMIGERDEPIVSSFSSSSHSCALCLALTRAPLLALLCAQARKIAFIGAGKMAEAILGGLPPINWDVTTAIDFSPTRGAVFKDRFGINAVTKDTEYLEGAQVVSAFFTSSYAVNGGAPASPASPTLTFTPAGQQVVLAVKPQNVEAALASVKGRFDSDTVIISIVAGMSMDELERLSGCPAIVRQPHSHPPTPASPSTTTATSLCWALWLTLPLPPGADDAQHSCDDRSRYDRLVRDRRCR